MTKLTHLDEKGRARMVDVGPKDPTRRTATARAEVLLSTETLDMVLKVVYPKVTFLPLPVSPASQAGKKLLNSFH